MGTFTLSLVGWVSLILSQALFSFTPSSNFRPFRFALCKPLPARPHIRRVHPFITIHLVVLICVSNLITAWSSCIRKEAFNSSYCWLPDVTDVLGVLGSSLCR